MALELWGPAAERCQLLLPSPLKEPDLLKLCLVVPVALGVEVMRVLGLPGLPLCHQCPPQHVLQPEAQALEPQVQQGHPAPVLRALQLCSAGLGLAGLMRQLPSAGLRLRLGQHLGRLERRADHWAALLLRPAAAAAPGVALKAWEALQGLRRCWDRA